MTAIIKDVTIDFANAPQKSVRDWLASLPAGAPQLPPLSIRVSMNVDLDMFDDDEIVEQYDKLFPTSGPWLERCYRLIAMGEIDEAMELIYREAPDGLAPPSTEKRIVARLLAKETPDHAEN